jgi:hypothetical protein
MSSTSKENESRDVILKLDEVLPETYKSGHPWGRDSCQISD